MEQIGLALILFAAFWVGGAAAYIGMRLRAQGAYEKGRSEAAVEISALTERLNGRDLQITEARQRAEAAAETITRLEAELRADADRRTVAGDFQPVTAEAIMVDNQAFLDRAGEALSRMQESARGDSEQRQSFLGQIMEPLKSSLDRVDSRISELERDRDAAYSSLQQQVECMLRTQVSLQADTAHLASALRTPASRGRWGEVQLRRVVELAGMIAHCDFIEPPAAAGRPDLIVQLPNFRQIAVDSKVSLAAYFESVDTPKETVRMEKRREHAAQVRAHVTQLSAQVYWDQFPHSPEFVIAFLPGESFFSAALEHDPELLEFGVERRVILATPTTLIALLRAVAWGWKQETVSLNATEIRDLGKALYDHLRALAGNLAEVQRGLSITTSAFNRTVGAFETTVIPSARRLSELGSAAGAEIGVPSLVDPAAAPQPDGHSVAALLSLHSALSNGDTSPSVAPVQTAETSVSPAL